jgi:hypothetical protein
MTDASNTPLTGLFVIAGLLFDMRLESDVFRENRLVPLPQMKILNVKRQMLNEPPHPRSSPKTGTGAKSDLALLLTLCRNPTERAGSYARKSVC